jgi:flagellar motor switch/type III secretory pathway protein FliN
VGRAASLDNREWQAFGHQCFFAWDGDLAVNLAKVALAAPVGKMALSATDKTLLGQFAGQMMEDLSNRIAKTLRLAAEPSDAAAVSRPLSSHGGLELELAHDKGFPGLLIALPASVLIPMRKTVIGSDALSEEALTFTAVLGEARLKAADLLALDEGDVIVLDTSVEGSVSFVSRKSGGKIGQARVMPDGGKLQLIAIAA